MADQYSDRIQPSSILTQRDRAYIAQLSQEIRQIIQQNTSDTSSKRDEEIAALLLAINKENFIGISENFKKTQQHESQKFSVLLQKNLTLAKQTRSLFWMVSTLLGVLIGLIIVTYIFPPYDKAAESNGQIVSQILDNQNRDQKLKENHLSNIEHGQKEMNDNLLTFYSASLQAYQNLDKTLSHKK